MGLLGKAIAINNAHAAAESVVSEGVVSGATHAIQSFIKDFHYEHPQFHGIILKGKSASSSEDVYGMIACHGAVTADLSGGNVLVLLPGALDRELFAHRLSRSADLPILSQVSADSPALAIKTLSPYLQ
jgi:hypothetical protein